MTAFKKGESVIEALRAFYMGKTYPALICTLVAVSAIFGLEIYVGILHAIAVSVGLFISKTFKPALVSLLSFVMQISVKHSPFYPSYSDYLHTGWHKYAVFGIFALIIVAICVFAVKNRVIERIFRSRIPLVYFLPLFLAFLTNGIFSEKWVVGNLGLGLVNGFLFCFLPIFIYHSFPETENSDGIAGYFSYVSLLVGLVVLAELVALFITNGEIFVNGSVNKTEVALGWGIWNLVGSTLAVIIPLIFYAIQKTKHPVLCFLSASAVHIGAVFTMSRNALIVSTLVYFLCVLISCFYGRYKAHFRIFAVVSLLALLILFAAFFDGIINLFRDYLDRGFSDNGRFALWGIAFDNFSSSPVFGVGFYGFDADDELLFSFGPLVKQAHSTPLQLLSATGLFGFFAYFFYRFFTLREIFHKFSLKKAFMALSVFALLLGSLLDNFIFNIYPLFSYAVSLVVIMKENREKPL